MSEAEGPASNYRDSVREMFRDLRSRNKTGNAETDQKVVGGNVNSRDPRIKKATQNVVSKKDEPIEEASEVKLKVEIQARDMKNKTTEGVNVVEKELNEPIQDSTDRDAESTSAESQVEKTLSTKTEVNSERDQKENKSSTTEKSEVVIDVSTTEKVKDMSTESVEKEAVSTKVAKTEKVVDEKKTSNVDDEEEDNEEADDGDEGESEDEVGEPDRPPGEGATRPIEPDHLLPFHHGWKREVIVHKGSSQVATQYEISYIPPENGQFRTREAKRKRISKSDQEKYFIDFPSPIMSIKNFSYVRRPLGLNNAAYEILRKGRAASPELKEKRGSKSCNSSGGRRVSSYREVEENAGLLDDDDVNQSEEDDEEVVCINGFEVFAPIAMQVKNNILGLRMEHKKRHRRRDPETCCTPPLAEDSLWSGLDDDPVGVYTELGGRSSPTTPPPLRALQLTRVETAERILQRYADVHASAARRNFLSDQPLTEALASHDAAIKMYKHFKDLKHIPAGTSLLQNKFLPLSNQEKQLLKNKNSRLASSLIMKPVSGQQPWSSKPSTTAGLRTCSMKCPGTGATMPNIQCISCSRLYHARCQGVSKQSRFFKCRLCRVAGPGLDTTGPIRASMDTIRMKLPMNSVNGKRPIVELVMLMPGGKYQPIKFSNNVQITEPIPKSMFEAANATQTTVYQKATQVPRVGNNSIYIAVNPVQRPADHLKRPTPQQPLTRPPTLPRPSGSGSGNSSLSSSGTTSTGVTPTMEQVSILVRPQHGGKTVLLNVPRKVALKVKSGTTLSFSASNDQKYVVVSNKMHPPVGGVSEKASASPSSSTTTKSSTPSRPPMSSTSARPSQPRPQGSGGISASAAAVAAAKSVFAGILPSSVSLQPISKPSNMTSSASMVNRKRPAVSVTINDNMVPKVRKADHVLSDGGQRRSSTFSLPSSLPAQSPCTPYCPGVTGFPEVECCECQSLFHLKCVGIPQAALPKIKNSFKCRMCVFQRSSKGSKVPSGPPAVIDLD